MTALGDDPSMSVHSTDPFAVLDLGSNSFHLLLVEPEGEEFVVVERLKEKVQLLAGFKDGEIQADAMQRGSDCLARFAQRLRPVRAENIRVIGTCALREATNQEVFTRRAESILGRPVEVVPGTEEARLVYLGVAHHVPLSASQLVIDIGGGSTEFGWGGGVDAAFTESVYLGCVALTEQHCGDRHVQSSGYRAARAAAVELLSRELDRSELAGKVRDCVESVYGTSGTIESVAMVLQVNGWTSDNITREGLARLEDAIVADRWVIDAGLPGLAPDRVDIFPAGVAILSACFEVLGLASMRFVDVSLMQGVICDSLLYGRAGGDRRDKSVAALAARFDVDRGQAARVAKSAERLFAETQDWWGDDKECGRLLAWAAQLHELGSHIDAKHYHRHGAYIVKHSDLAGFSRVQQSALALLVRGHRRSFPGLAFHAFDAQLADKLKRLVALLRIAAILERSHSDADSPQVALRVAGDTLHLACGEQWLAQHPLSRRELEVETSQLAAAGLALIVE